MRIVVAGAGGFIGGHLVRTLENQGHSVIAADIKPEGEWFQLPTRTKPLILDLRLKESCFEISKDAQWVFNLACNMGGMGFIENNKAACMESVLINTHLLQAAREYKIERYFFSSTACVYAASHQKTLSIHPLKESDAYPAEPEDGYGWEKLFSERMCRHFYEDYGVDVRIARYHNVYGPFGTFKGGREKVPAAACRKVFEFSTQVIPKIEIWGDGKQLRSFTFIDDCVDGTLKLMNSNFREPLNIGSSQTVSIQDLYQIVGEISGITLGPEDFIYDLNAPQGVRGRSSDNELCRQVLNWEPTTSLSDGLKQTFSWISKQISNI